MVPLVMVATDKLIDKLRNETIEKSELVTLLSRFGFKRYGGKGSHEVWGDEKVADLHIVLATHTKEIPRYQLRQIIKSLKKRSLL